MGPRAGRLPRAAPVPGGAGIADGGHHRGADRRLRGERSAGGTARPRAFHGAQIRRGLRSPHRGRARRPQRGDQSVHPCGRPHGAEGRLLHDHLQRNGNRPRRLPRKSHRGKLCHRRSARRRHHASVARTQGLRGRSLHRIRVGAARGRADAGDAVAEQRDAAAEEAASAQRQVGEAGARQGRATLGDGPAAQPDGEPRRRRGPPAAHQRAAGSPAKPRRAGAANGGGARREAGTGNRRRGNVFVYQHVEPRVPTHATDKDLTPPPHRLQQAGGVGSVSKHLLRRARRIRWSCGQNHEPPGCLCLPQCWRRFKRPECKLTQVGRLPPNGGYGAEVYCRMAFLTPTSFI